MRKQYANPRALGYVNPRAGYTDEHIPMDQQVEIFIPSRSRFTRSKTLEALQHGGMNERAVLVVPYHQGVDYLPLARKHKIYQVLRCKEEGIAATRRFIGEHAKDKFAMLDDDLTFFRRNCAKPKDVSLHKFNEQDMAGLFILLARTLDHFKHVAIGAREGNNRQAIPYVENSRPLRFLAYRKEQFLQCKHGRVTVMEDFDVTLQLMEMGFPNCVITEYVHDQLATAAPGGCADYRTHASHSRAAHLLAKLHPDVVTLRRKENKTGGDFGTRTEVTIHWKKAFTTATEELL